MYKWIVITLQGLLVSGAANALEDSKLEYFESKIRPILVSHCLECHSAAKKVRGGLILDNHAGLLKGGDTGTVIVPGKPELSLL
ncbi:MAG: c-type cytochrome domain-containing protein, partial [Gemmataceae bacterium]